MVEAAAVFPGQGSQYVGMGRELAEAYPEVRDAFQEADASLGFSLSTLCFSGPEEELRRTENTQPALLATSVAIYRLLEARGFRPKAAAGHSVGEYSALVAAGALSFDAALRTVRLRGRLMEEAVPHGKGTMAAVIGLSAREVEEICREIPGVVEPATYNGPGQVVVAGETAAVEALAGLAKARGAKRVQPLNVSGPFHSSLLSEAGEKLGAWLSGIRIDRPRIPVYANTTAASIESPEAIRKSLTDQVSSPVRWEESVRAMVDAGIGRFVEVGPGRVLSGLIRRIHKESALANVEDQASFEAFTRAFGEGEGS